MTGDLAVDELHVFGGWKNLCNGHLTLAASPCDQTGVMLNIKVVIAHTDASISTLVSFPGFEVLELVQQFDQLYDRKAGEAILPCDVPGVALRFQWYDVSRCIAELNGTLVQELSTDGQLWRFCLDIREFRFEGFYLQRIAKLLRQVLVDHAIDTTP